MALQPNSYGDPAEIATLVPRWATVGGVFDPTTRPALTTVESLCDQISAALNALLAKNGFTVVPAASQDPDAKLLFDFFVNQEVASVADGINGLGRFGPTNKQGGGKGRWALLVEDVEAFIKVNAIGLERLGALRPQDEASGLLFREFDEAGLAVSPLFQRKAFGDVQQDWDTSANGT